MQIEKFQNIPLASISTNANTKPIEVTIGQYADYYIEFDETMDMSSMDLSHMEEVEMPSMFPKWIANQFPKTRKFVPKKG